MTKKQNSIEGAKEKQGKKEPNGKEKKRLPWEGSPLQIAEIRHLDKKKKGHAHGIGVRKKEEKITAKGK